MSTFKAYILGLCVSGLLTLAAFVPVMIYVGSGRKAFAPNALLAWILVLAVAQLIAQLFLFLHLGREKKPRWNMLIFSSTVGLILIVILGSLWIMGHLNYNMTPQQIRDYIINSGTF